MIKLGIYQHYRGNLYQVFGLARHSENLEPLVVYQALYGDFGMWVRPQDLFMGTIEYNGQVVPRFKFLHEALAELPQVRD